MLQSLLKIPATLWCLQISNQPRCKWCKELGTPWSREVCCPCDTMHVRQTDRQRDWTWCPFLFQREETETRLCKDFHGQHILNPIFEYFPIPTKKGSRLAVLKRLGWQNLVFSFASITRSSTNSPGYLLPEMPSSSWHGTLQRWQVWDCHPLVGTTLKGLNVTTSVLWPE